ncbi:MAG: M56 family metallopeptidase, partial [Gemmatimonadetes bacterium]|nr:M56 family metallopeptidase [Gemmatimonadota bacterium]
MTLSWIVYGLLVGTLLAATARGLEEVCRLARFPTRWVWAAALATTVALAGLAPRRDLPRPVAVASFTPSGPVRARVASSWSDEVRLALTGARSALAESLRGAVAAVERHAPPALDRYLAGSWMVLSAALLVVFAGVYARFHGARRGWPVTVLHGTRVRLAPGVGPAVVGLSRPEIVVPRWLLAHTAEEQRLVLAHEHEHVAARDPLLLAGACLAAVLLPWHPAVWWMLSRLRLAVELDCDRRVLHRGVPPQTYGALLIELAGRCSGLRVGAIALADESSHLERRLLAMKPHFSRFAPVRAAAVGAAALLALVAACEARLPTSAEVDDMDVASAQRSMRRVSVTELDDSRTVFLVDGARVTAAEAKAIEPERIGEISINRGKTEGEPSQVLITT